MKKKQHSVRAPRPAHVQCSSSTTAPTIESERQRGRGRDQRPEAETRGREAETTCREAAAQSTCSVARARRRQPSRASDKETVAERQRGSDQRGRETSLTAHTRLQTALAWLSGHRPLRRSVGVRTVLLAESAADHGGAAPDDRAESVRPVLGAQPACLRVTGAAFRGAACFVQQMLLADLLPLERVRTAQVRRAGTLRTLTARQECARARVQTHAPQSTVHSPPTVQLDAGATTISMPT